MYSEIIELLAEGDKRTTRGVDEVVQRALATPAVMRSIVDCLEMDDEALAMRASDALQKVGAKRPTLLEPYRSSDWHLSVQSAEGSAVAHGTDAAMLCLTTAEAQAVTQTWRHNF